jgi:hypothetical protein
MRSVKQLFQSWLSSFTFSVPGRHRLLAHCLRPGAGAVQGGPVEFCGHLEPEKAQEIFEID